MTRDLRRIPRRIENRPVGSGKPGWGDGEPGDFILIRKENTLFEKARIERGLYWDRLLRWVDGCTPCSPGCQNDWAAREAKFRTYGAKDLLGPDGMWNGKIRLRHDNLDLPRRTKKPQSWLILNDLFHEDVPVDFIQAAFDNMSTCGEHIFLLLTKRIKRMAGILPHLRFIGGMKFQDSPGPNIWPGVTVCNSDELWKMDELRKIPAAVHWVSFEPLLSDLGKINFDHIEWTVLGGESGPGARPMKIEWARDVVGQCKAAGIPVFMKQIHLNGKVSRSMDEWPEDLRVRRLPGIPRGPGLSSYVRCHPDDIGAIRIQNRTLSLAHRHPCPAGRFDGQRMSAGSVIVDRPLPARTRGHDDIDIPGQRPGKLQDAIRVLGRGERHVLAAGDRFGKPALQSVVEQRVYHAEEFFRQHDSPSAVASPDFGKPKIGSVDDPAPDENGISGPT